MTRQAPGTVPCPPLPGLVFKSPSSEPHGSPAREGFGSRPSLSAASRKLQTDSFKDPRITAIKNSQDGVCRTVSTVTKPQFYRE